ncbi:hypothetical protein [Fibrella aquatica]|uniref:hypothetical protein n=1 Tax=Fibrella aquatica TaxID=3242487 RepID=UPI0035225B55
MKTSIKLLIGLALFLVVTMFGAAVSIRHQFDSIDKSDKYARWQKKPLPAFQNVHISGPSAAIVQIEPGKTPRLLADSLGEWKRPTYTYKVERDTLFLKVNPVDGWSFRVEDEDDEWHSPQLVVQLPTLQAVSTVNALCQIHEFEGDALTVNQSGKGGITLIEHVRYNQLTASLTGRNQLVLYGINNNIQKGTITARDSSRLFQYTDFKQGLILTADPTAKLRLTGKALQQVKE